MRYVLEELWINTVHPLDDGELTMEGLQEGEYEVVLGHTADLFEEGLDGITLLETNEKLQLKLCYGFKV